MNRTVARWCHCLFSVIAFTSASVVDALTLELDGPMTQGGLVQGRTDPGAKVVFNGRPVRVSDDGIFLIAFGRDADSRARLLVTGPNGDGEERILKVEKRKYKIQRIDGLPPRKVTPKKSDLERIKRDIARAKQARERDDPRTDFRTGFIWPVRARISGVYGSQRILNGKPRRPHYGVDMAAPVGTPVEAPADGVITLVEPDMFFSGGTMILDHGHGLSSSFLHLSEILVQEGQRVRQAEVIAKVGATGRATGPHLDWRMNLFTDRIDPQLLAGPMSVK